MSKDLVIAILALVLVFVVSTKRPSPPVTNIVTLVQRDTVVDKSLIVKVDSLDRVIARAKKENKQLRAKISDKIDRYEPDTTLCDSLIVEYQALTDTLEYQLAVQEQREVVKDSMIMIERFLFNETNTKLIQASESLELYKKKQDNWWNRNQKYVYFGLGVVTTYIAIK